MEKETISVSLFLSFLLDGCWNLFFRQLLGVENDEVNVDDPCSDELYNYFRSTAKKNATIYEEVFNTIPTNTIRKFVDVEAYVDRPKLKETDPLAVWTHRHLSLSLFLFGDNPFLSRLTRNVKKFEVSSSSFPWNSLLTMFWCPNGTHQKVCSLTNHEDSPPFFFQGWLRFFSGHNRSTMDKHFFSLALIRDKFLSFVFLELED